MKNTTAPIWNEEEQGACIYYQENTAGWEIQWVRAEIDQMNIHSSIYIWITSIYVYGKQE